MSDVVLASEPFVDRVHILDDRDVHVGAERHHLIVIERREKSVPPAKGRMGVDDQMLGVLGLGENVLEHGPP